MNLKTISYSQAGYTLDIPALDQTHFISWDSIETIIYGSEIIYKDHSEFIIYLNKPPVINLKENAWWLNRWTFWMRSKNLKIRMSDEWNKDFPNFIQNIRLYLKNVHEVDINSDPRKGQLITRTIKQENNKISIKEHWKPEEVNDLKWEMVYDKFNKSVKDIYNRDKGI